MNDVNSLTSPSSIRSCVRLPRPLWIGVTAVALLVGSMLLTTGLRFHRQMTAIRAIESRGGAVGTVRSRSGLGVMLIGAQWGNSMIGRLLALSSTFSMALMTSIIRRGGSDIPLLHAVAGSTWLCSAFCLPFARPLVISPFDLGLCAVFGIVQNAEIGRAHV